MTGATEKLFDQVEGFIRTSRALLGDNVPVHLSGMDDDIETLCRSILALSAQERVQYEARLQGLIADLTLLGEELTTKRNALGAEIDQVGTQKKAHKAYRVSDAIDGFHQKKDTD